MSYYYDKETEIVKRIKAIEEEIYLLLHACKTYSEMFEFEMEV